MTIETIKFAEGSSLNFSDLSEKWVKMVEDVEWLRFAVSRNLWSINTYRYLRVTKEKFLDKHGAEVIVTKVTYNAPRTIHHPDKINEWLEKLAKSLQHDGFVTNQEDLSLSWIPRPNAHECDGRHGAGCAHCCP